MVIVNCSIYGGVGFLAHALCPVSPTDCTWHPVHRFYTISSFLGQFCSMVLLPTPFVMIFIAWGFWHFLFCWSVSARLGVVAHTQVQCYYTLVTIVAHACSWSLLDQLRCKCDNDSLWSCLEAYDNSVTCSYDSSLWHHVTSSITARGCTQRQRPHRFDWSHHVLFIVWFDPNWVTSKHVHTIA